MTAATAGPSGPSSRPGLSSRQPLFGRAHTDQVQINMEAGPAFDLDSEIDQLRSSVGRLKEVSTAIEEENKLTRQVMEGLDDAMEKARSSLRKTIKRIDRAYRDGKSNHMLYLFVFALTVFFIVYAWNRVYKLFKWLF